MGPSSGATPGPWPPSVSLSSTLASPNRFAPLEPQYQPLAFINIDIKSPDMERWRSTRAMVNCGGQGSFINKNLSKSYQLPHQPKRFSVLLVLADGRPSQAGPITHYNP